MEDQSSRIKIKNGRVERIDEICSSLAALSRQENFQDVRMVCQDGEVRGARLVLALAFPHMEEAMEEREEEELVLILPHMQAVDVTNRLEDFLRYLPKVEVKDEMGSDGDYTNADEIEEEDDLLDHKQETKVEARIDWESDENEEEDELMSENSDNDIMKEDEPYYRKTYKTVMPVGGLFPCPDCDKTFKDRKYLWSHKAKQHRKEHLKCHMCSKAFKQKSNLDRHMKVHEDGHEERIKELREQRKKAPLVKSCTICVPEVKLPNNVVAHYLRQHRVSSLFVHPCPHCWEWFPSIDDLNNHITFHTEQSDMLNCRLCSFTVPAKGASKPPSKFSSRTFGQKSIDAHLNIHQNGLYCEHCAKEFNDTKLLKSHLEIHKEKNEVCNECGARFRKKVMLKEHIELKHTRSLDYMCDMCDKRFPTGRYLTLHRQRHNSVSPYSCEVCGKSFKTNGDMKCHYYAIHTDKPKKVRKKFRD